MLVRASSLIYALIVVMACAGDSLAAVYQWEDRQGVMHFTDNPESIPSRYLHKARKIDQNENDTVSTTETTGEPTVQAQQEAAPVAEQTLIQGSSDREKDREYWQMRFRTLRGELNSLKEELPDKTKRMGEFRHNWLTNQKRAERQAVNQLEDEIARDNERILDLEKQLELLDVEAARNSVPFEWRK